MAENKPEMVMHPKHYAADDAPCECIDVIHYVTKDLPGDVAVGVGNTLKYLWRLGKKAPDADNGQTLEEKTLEDMQKSEWYLSDAIRQMIQHLKSKENKNVTD